MKKTDLRFVNWLQALERKLGKINDITSNSLQHEDLDDQEQALLKKLHNTLFWSGEVTFDKQCLDSSKLRVKS